MPGAATHTTIIQHLADLANPKNGANANPQFQAFLTDPNLNADWATSCTVANLGGVPSAGLAEFYVGDQFSTANPNHAALTPTQVQANAQLIGRTSFVAPPGTTITVVCPNLWIISYPNIVAMGALVQVRDLITDPLVAPFDAINDRHVARNDDMFDPHNVA